MNWRLVLEKLLLGLILGSEQPSLPPDPTSLKRWLLAKLHGLDPASSLQDRESFARKALSATLREFSPELPLESGLMTLFERLPRDQKHMLVNLLEENPEQVPETLVKYSKIAKLPDAEITLSYSNLDSFSQEGEDLLLRQLLAGRENGFYVDIGAHHPYRFSNTAYFYNRGWRGINVDPAEGTRALFDKERPRDINLEIAIGDQDGEADLHVFQESALNTLDRERVAALAETTTYRVKNIRRVPIRRLNSVLQEHLHAGQVIDFMSIDIEGMEAAILPTNDWNRFRPRFILLEVLGSSLRELDRHPTIALMKGHDYEPVVKSPRSVFLESTRK